MVFIQYIHTGSFHPRWCLIQVLLDLIHKLNLDFTNNNHYLCTFLARQPKDGKKHDNIARWWLEWYGYQLGHGKVLVFGKRDLFHTNRTPNLTKHRLWIDTDPLSNNIVFFGYFSFDPRQDIINWS